MAALVATRSSDDGVLLSHFHEHDTAAGLSGGGGGSSAGSGGGGAGGCPAGPRGKSRKGKHGPKKQPQRGLGVAQLEKLRLQEQSKQEAACLASLGVLMGPGMGYGLGPDHGSLAPLCLPAHVLARPALKTPSPSPSPTPTTVAAAAAAAALLVPAWANKGHCPADPSAALLMSRQSKPLVVPVCKPKSYDGLAASRGPPINLFDSSHPPGPIQLKRELSLLGVPTVPAELSSFQTKHPAGNGNGNGHRPGPVCSNVGRQWLFFPSTGLDPLVLVASRQASVGSQQKHQHSSAPRLVMVSQAETHPAASSSNKPSTTTDSSLKAAAAAAAAAAHYTPPCISSALGTSLPFLKTISSRASDELVKPRKVMLELDNRMTCCIPDPDSLSAASSKKRGPCTYSYVDESLAPTAKRSSSNSNSSGGGGDFLALSLSITSSANNECTILSSGDSHPLRKPLSMEETGTELEECSARSPSYGSSTTTVDLPANKCTEIDLSLKL